MRRTLLLSDGKDFRWILFLLCFFYFSWNISATGEHWDRSEQPLFQGGVWAGCWGKEGVLSAIRIGNSKVNSCNCFFQSRTVVRWRSAWNCSRSLRHSVKTMPGKRTISTTYTTHMIEFVSLSCHPFCGIAVVDVSGLIFAFPNQSVLIQNLVSPFY